MTKKPELTATKLAARHYLSQLWHDRLYSIPAMILPGLATIMMTYVPPLIVAAVVVRLANDQPTLDIALPYLILFAATWLVGEALWRLTIYFLNRTDARGMIALYRRAMDELLKKDIGFFHNNFAGSITKKAIGYGRNYENFSDTLSFSVFSNVLPLIFAFVILWRYSPLLVIVLFGLISLVVVIIVPLIRRRRKLVEAREEASNVMAGHMADVIGNMDAVQAFAHEAYEARQHRRFVNDYMKKARRSWDYHNTRIDMSISPIYVLINVLGLAVAIMLGNDAANIAAIFVTFNYYVYATRILWEFNRIYRNIESSITDAAQFTQFLLEDADKLEVKNPVPLNITKGEIVFKNVVFRYMDSDESLFQNFNLRIRAGEKLALVGHSGGGKTTVTKLLLRFKELTGGQLLIDGQDIAASNLTELRDSVAYVPQEPIMFHRSLADNIRYGKLEATDEEVVSAAQKANASEFIDRLPNGYDTLVGERGVKLSGGQRQRVAIARAIIKDAPILVLDEATSALDSESEKLIQEALWKLMKGRTAIVIAHRLSTIQKMDRIIVLNNGEIVEEGSHQELLKKSGIYDELWSHQSGGFLDE
jgi:ATP-binding cassette subfamily B protein